MNKVSAIESPRLTVTYLSVSDLTPDPRNARTHPKRQIDQIRASIEASALPIQFPLIPVVVSSRAGFKQRG
jgi:hypothetical protein